MMMQLCIGDFLLDRSDFGNELRDRVAFDLAFLMGVGVGNKEALLEAIYFTADEVVERVRQEMTE